ncbi:MAG: hypothetical protein ACR2PI_14985 [Hyphomicrobiaceae bacterium]
MNKRVGITGIAAMAALLLAPASEASAQKISKKSVKTLMQYALSYTPDRFTGSDGNTIHINRKDPEAIKKLLVPLPKAEEAVLAGRLAAHARVCGLFDEEKNTFISFVVREKRSKKWTPQQIIYLRALFYTTEMLMVGKVQVVQRDDGGKKVVIKEGKAAIKSCTDQQRGKVKELVANYIKAGPDLTKLTGNEVKSKKATKAN